MLHCLSEPFESLCRRLQNLQVRYVELVDDGWHSLNEKRVKKLVEIAENEDLIFTLHSPFADINIAAPNQNMRNFVLKRLRKSMEFAHTLDCNLMVFHPGFQTGISSFYPGMDWKLNIDSVQKLLSYARELHMVIAIENCPEPFGFLLKNVEQFSRFFDELGEEIGLVLDVGHTNINDQTHEFIEAFGDKIAHIHAHDNKGDHDYHMGVGLGTVDWERFAEDIKRAHFQGIVMIESIDHLKDSIVTLRRLLS
jgi:sugar phosphate isomerase/epimerase